MDMLTVSHSTRRDLVLFKWVSRNIYGFWHSIVVNLVLKDTLRDSNVILVSSFARFGVLGMSVSWILLKVLSVLRLREVRILCLTQSSAPQPRGMILSL